ncbi:hypothetical protein CDD81_697 [Ophiocordyceps australis]|uniref:ubiquitinyl hydrolase 1 n=1 Tax=Ophiocordyceps australis TaxID=1399860 RepID=A0A2C5Y2H5_9HYPO|nr:hypothetical protein CDD81_697 [Ophiocordyceps australis]
MASVRSAFYHLVLPNQLPDHQEDDLDAIGRDILTRCLDACAFLEKKTSSVDAAVWKLLSRALNQCQGIIESRLEAKSLLDKLADLDHNRLLIVRLAAQNAALLIYRKRQDESETVIFEAFETSPASKDVLASDNAMDWLFPGCAVEVPFATFQYDSFTKNLALFIQKASEETLPRFSARAIKSGSCIIETRDPPHPGLISQFLMALLGAVGNFVEVPEMKKRVRDDINFCKGEMPWRRCPSWLVLRVAMQRQLGLVLGQDVGRAAYKLVICAMLEQLLDACASVLSPELAIILKAKLCRRLAKLERVKEQSPELLSSSLEQIYSAVKIRSQGTVERVTQQVEAAWKQYKMSVTRTIPELPCRANDDALRLSLHNSQNHLQQLLKRPFKNERRVRSENPLVKDDTEDQMRKLAQFSSRLETLEALLDLKILDNELVESQQELELRCISFCESIYELFALVGDAYLGKPDQMSLLILRLLELWVQMDKSACKVCPLLYDYSILFPPETLDVLHLARISEMQRLQSVQLYLSERRQRCGASTNTIYSEPSLDSFAVRYMSQSEDGARLRTLLNQILAASQSARKSKETEWEQLCQEYDGLTDKIASATCLCTIEQGGQRDVRGCTKCWYWRCRKRMTINAHEDYLPEGTPERAAVIFELGIPWYLQHYRNATWRIFRKLGYSGPKRNASEAMMLLKDYELLKQYKVATFQGISLASSVKSFLQTHYAKVRMKADSESVFLPQGLVFHYYDQINGEWLQDFPATVSFQHHCGLSLPRALLDASIRNPRHPAWDDGPSSYETVASLMKCPRGMSIQEFMALQRLIGGKNRRLLTMLVELGSSNINMSDEESLRLMTELTLQAGPLEETTDVLRDVHVVFRDEKFCQRLSEQINQRLGMIKANWREAHCMEFLVTLALRLHNLGSANARQEAEKALRTARETILGWIMSLRINCRAERNAEAAKRLSRYAFRAAIICRRTFAVFEDSGRLMNGDELCSFVIASIALQQNSMDISALGPKLHGFLMNDSRLAFRLRSVIEKSVRSSPRYLGEAIVRSMRGDLNTDIAECFSQWVFPEVLDHYWVTFDMCRLEPYEQGAQTVQYHLLEGHLKINGQILGRLPVELMNSNSVKELFGDQNLTTFPSSYGDLSHVLADQFHGHEVHLGIRDGQVVIRAHKRLFTFEYIPAKYFYNSGRNNFDLPEELVLDCAHWLNLDTGILEIRRRPKIWVSRPGNWKINLHNGQAFRRGSKLVDPRSMLCQKIHAIYSGFEQPQRLTVFQPRNSSLSVFLHRLKLTFQVNAKNLLECRELRSEIDPNQDAGTLYGLQSKLVLRDSDNTQRRSILAGLGELVYQRRGMHVAVGTRDITAYARYEIDAVLGRLLCPPEPRLLYSKALFHALTSFILSDPLTGSTGTEEAYRILSSGHCQPWKPLHQGTIEHILKEIQRLSPVREYYPSDKRQLQCVSWNPHLTVTIQHDCYYRLVEGILEKSQRLEAFDGTKHAKQPMMTSEVATNTHLRDRAEIRRSLLERSLSETWTMPYQSQWTYRPRDRLVMTSADSNVYETVALLRQRPFTACLNISLANMLEQFPNQLIGGFATTSYFASQSLDQLIDGSISEQWGSLVNCCCASRANRDFDAIFRLGLLSFSPNANREAIKFLCAFSVMEELGGIAPPVRDVFRSFKFEERPSNERLEELIKGTLSEAQPHVKVQRLEVASASPESKENPSEEMILAKHLVQQWPSAQLSYRELDSLGLGSLDIDKVQGTIEPEWRRLVDNELLSRYIVEVQSVIDRYMCRQGPDISIPRNLRLTLQETASRMPTDLVPCLAKDLLTRQAPKMPEFFCLGQRLQEAAAAHFSGDQHEKSRENLEQENGVMNEVKGLLERFAQSPKPLWQQYGNDLLQSYYALQDGRSSKEKVSSPPNLVEIDARINMAEKSLEQCLGALRRALSTNNGVYKWLNMGNLWPRATPVTVLQLLRTRDKNIFGPGMKELLVAYGTLIATLQWLLRIKREYMRGDEQKLLEQWNDRGHGNWDPFEYPDWLLLEIESNIFIRPEQVEVAHAIIQPPSSANSLLQLNMGKGKTSCIVPMVVSVLADSKRLCRLIVPKALTQQAAQILQSRIGGLLGREIRQVPFSRRTPTSSCVQAAYLDLHRQVRDSSGVILAVPEHILSYKLSGFQRLADGKLEEAQAMFQGQDWLDSTCRDVLDESDFTLAVKTQLIYPSGQLVPVDGHPDRWVLAQSLLSLVEDRLSDLCSSFPNGIQVLERTPGFPMIYITHSEVEKALRDSLTEAIIQGRTSFLPVSISLSKTATKMLRKLLSEDAPERQTFERVERALAATPSIYKGLVLARGLLLQGILFLCLRKRWNVQYGLHPDRDPIAVPYEAKGVPSAQAEFGHPDVAILLTCLAFYYSGLTVAQLRDGLGHVLKSDDPGVEYDRWTAGCDTLPRGLGQWNLVNADDSGQVEELWHHLRLNKSVLNHFMNNFVFPRHAKQFNLKLQSSGWDLPLSSFNASHPLAKTTGFSGTNDNRRLLPLLIKQHDLASLKHTSAEVLTYLLEERNRQYTVAKDAHGARLSETELLKTLRDKQIRVLIDAGAYILEMDNRSLVKKWLQIDHKAKAGVYLGADDNRAWVQYRNGKEAVPLLATPFAENLSECLVYLDEAHTRGTDLQLPKKAHGALTLALGQTKDHTVQAAMRLRKLATTQSISFWAPPEVHQSIVEWSGKQPNDEFSSIDVVGWLLEQTCCANEQLQGLFIAQGLNFCRRQNAVLENPLFLSSSSQRSAVLNIVKSTEHLTLDELYGNKGGCQAHESVHGGANGGLQALVEQLDKQTQVFVHGESSMLANAMDQVEQEREVEFQVEEVREVQKPKHRKALSFPGLHQSIAAFIQTGLLSASNGCQEAGVFLAHTGLGKQHKLEISGSKLLVSEQFSRTVETGPNRPIDDNYARSVEWVLWSPATQVALVVIPEEAEIVIPLIRGMPAPMVHLLAYSAPVTRHMLRFGQLEYYALPSLAANHVTPTWLSIELGILGARLYFGHCEYGALLEHLEALDSPSGGQQIAAKRLLAFVFEWLTVRRKGQDILHTPMGYVCQGRTLGQDHAFFGRGAEAATRLEASRATASETGPEDPRLSESDEATQSEDEYD